MTVLTEKREDGKILVRLEGHAGYAGEGDVVCAAASILVHTLLENFPGCRKLYDPECPAIEMEIPDTQENSIRYGAVRKGFALLEENYPENFKSRGEV